MKKFALIMVTLCFLYSCKNQQSHDNRIIIAGELKGAEGEIIAVYTIGELERTLLNENGAFELTIAHDHPFYFNFSVKNQLFQLYLEPGDSIFLYAELEDFYSTFQASGSKERETHYITKKGAISQNLGSFYAFTHLPTNEYLIRKEEYLAPFYDLLTEMEAETGLNKDFLFLEKVFIEYNELTMDNDHPSSYRNAHGIPDDEAIDFPEQEIKDKVNNLNLDDPLKINLFRHRLLIDRRVRRLQAEMYEGIPNNEKNSSLWMKYMLMAVDSLFKHPKVNCLTKYWFIYHNLTMSGPADILDSYNQFVSENTLPMYTQRLEKIMQQWETLQPGSTIPDFVFTDVDGNELSFCNLKGKPIYILIWDTGCGPCRYEHSFWNILVDEYSDRNMQFITISFDRDKEEWVNYLGEKALSGIHLYQENHFISPFANHFMIQGVPKFIILDKEGKLFNVNAPRASGAIREELEKLLNTTL